MNILKPADNVITVVLILEVNEYYKLSYLNLFGIY